ncbi:MAG: right-handed parallel beta-helix repeat-containing protein [Candidatus Eisenbacteria bacterium]|nr:right-handed parallel beta-helix repeat-containing protein [Candidatus Eisenbacteria bacterium]
MRAIILLLFSLLLLIPVASDARTWLVRQDGSGDCTTIQACIDSAAAGDTVLVGPGDYYEPYYYGPLTISGKNIALISEQGTAVTSIHGGDFHRAIHCTNVPATGVIRGLTITNGQYSGYYWPNNAGSGIFCESSDVQIIDNVITDNSGGGIAADAASVLYVSGNTISNNTGGWPEYGSVDGSGIYCLTSQAVIENNEFIGNEDMAVACQGSSPVVRRNIMRDGSGGVSCRASSQAEVYENLIVDGTGYGVYISYSSPTVHSNTIVNNQVGIALDSASPLLENNIVIGSEWYGIDCAQPHSSSPTLHCNDVWNNSRGNYYTCTSVSEDFSANPLFCDPAAGDYHINCTSPCANHPGCGQVGALGVGCGPTSVLPTTWGKIKALFR